MKSFRLKVTLWFTLSLIGVLSVFVAITYTHLRHELRIEKWERNQPGKGDWNLHGSYSEAEVDDIAGELWRLSLLYSLPAAALALGVGYFLAKRSFKPIDEMNAQLLAIHAKSLAQRIHLTHADREFRAIEENINALLARLDGSFKQLTEFSAQVAHELRTPLTHLRLQVEEAAGRVEPELAEALQEELTRLSDYVDQCLLLATAEQGRLRMAPGPVSLGEVLTEMIETYEVLAAAEGRGITLHLEEVPTVTVDKRALKQALHNLLTNALKHGEGSISVSVKRVGSDAFCRISNLISPKPQGGNTGIGLGLRIVRALASAQAGFEFREGTEENTHFSELAFRASKSG